MSAVIAIASSVAGAAAGAVAGLGAGATIVTLVAVATTFATIIITVVTLVAVERTARANHDAALRATGGSRTRQRAVQVAVRLLPPTARDEYREEWAAWVHDLRSAGTPRYRRVIEMASIILLAAPRLALMLRLRPRQVVEQ